MDEARQQKIDAFLDEIQVVYDKYQLHLVPYIEFSPAGIIPKFSVKDTLPKPAPAPQAQPAEENTPNTEKPIDNGSDNTAQ